VLLPQIASREGWDRETFLDHVCLKAGLKRGSWRDGGEIFTFRANVFGEADFGGRVWEEGAPGGSTVNP
jgi:AMMECR1 domain-containing protein